MSAYLRCSWLAAVVFSVLLTSEAALACHVCKQTPCVMAPPAPALECVTEMVPVTVMKTRTRVDLVPVCTKTVSETKIDIEYDEQLHDVCRPISIRSLRHGARPSAGRFVKRRWSASLTRSAGQ